MLSPTVKKAGKEEQMKFDDLAIQQADQRCDTSKLDLKVINKLL